MNVVRNWAGRCCVAIRKGVAKWTATVGRMSLEWFLTGQRLLFDAPDGLVVHMDYRISGCYFILQGEEKNLAVKVKPVEKWAKQPYVGPLQGLLRNMVPWYNGNADRPGFMYLKLRTASGQTYWSKFCVDNYAVQHTVHLPQTLKGSACPMLHAAAIIVEEKNDDLGWKFVGCFESVRQWFGPNEDGHSLPGCRPATVADVLDDAGYNEETDCLLLLDKFQRAFILGGHDQLTWPTGRNMYSAMGLPLDYDSDAVDWIELLPPASFRKRPVSE